MDTGSKRHSQRENERVWAKKKACQIAELRGSLKA